MLKPYRIIINSSSEIFKKYNILPRPKELWIMCSDNLKYGNRPILIKDYLWTK